MAPEIRANQRWRSSVAWQLRRYAIVGIATNVVVFLAYLVLTRYGLEHKMAMTSLYVLGTSQAYLLNRHWTFAHRSRGALSRFIIAYATGYLLNWLGLCMFVDRLGMQHQLVQGFLVATIALLLFHIQRRWVFR